MSFEAVAVTVKCIFGDLQTVVEITSLAEATVQKLVRDGEFPKPRQISARGLAGE